MPPVLFSIILVLLLLPLNALSQITCFTYQNGWLSCDGPNNSNTLIVPFAGTSSGMIHTERSSEPYRILPPASASEDRGSTIIDRFERRSDSVTSRPVEPLRRLDRLDRLSDPLSDPLLPLLLGE